MLVADARTKRSTMQMADWIFQPPASGYSLMDWQHFAQIAASGYEMLPRSSSRTMHVGDSGRTGVTTHGSTPPSLSRSSACPPLPRGRNLRAFWDNIVAGRDCISDVPPRAGTSTTTTTPIRSVPDRTYCRRGGFVPDVDFDPLEWGLPPNSLEVTDVAQLLSLVLAKRAFADAGYGDGASAFDRERTGVVLGVGGGQKLITPLDVAPPGARLAPRARDERRDGRQRPT